MQLVIHEGASDVPRLKAGSPEVPVFADVDGFPVSGAAHIVDGAARCGRRSVPPFF